MVVPQRVQITRNGYGRATFPRGAERVDRASRWRSPFWIDDAFLAPVMRMSFNVDNRTNRMILVARLYFFWIMGLTLDNPMWWGIPGDVRAALPDPPNLLDVERSLRGKILADWAPLGHPCIGDVLLSIANRKPDGSLFPTASDGFQPDNSELSRRSAKRSREYQVNSFGT